MENQNGVSFSSGQRLVTNPNEDIEKVGLISGDISEDSETPRDQKKKRPKLLFFLLLIFVALFGISISIFLLGQSDIDDSGVSTGARCDWCAGPDQCIPATGQSGFPFSGCSNGNCCIGDPGTGGGVTPTPIQTQQRCGPTSDFACRGFDVNTICSLNNQTGSCQFTSGDSCSCNISNICDNNSGECSGRAFNSFCGGIPGELRTGVCQVTSGLNCRCTSSSASTPTPTPSPTDGGTPSDQCRITYSGNSFTVSQGCQGRGSISTYNGPTCPTVDTLVGRIPVSGGATYTPLPPTGLCQQVDHEFGDDFGTPDGGVCTCNTTTATTPTPTPSITNTPTPTPPNTNPRGYFDGVNCTRLVGWTCDPDNFGQILDVHVYVDDPNNPANFIGSFPANVVREQAVADQCGGFAAHGFEIPIPSGLYNTGNRSFFVYGINIGAGVNTLLSNSPRSLDTNNCNVNCHRCTPSLTDGNTCETQVFAGTCGSGWNLNPNCFETAGGACPAQIQCFRCTASLGDGNNCESQIFNQQTCPAGWTSNSNCFEEEVGGFCPAEVECYVCTPALGDDDDCELVVFSGSSCPVGTSSSPTGCATAIGGSCESLSPITCYRCTSSIADGDTCESFEADTSCPTGSSSDPDGCGIAAGGYCLQAVSCNGECGGNRECVGGLSCISGFCRLAANPTSETCQPPSGSILCYRCTSRTDDGNTCESILHEGTTCPTGYTQTSDCRLAVGGACPQNIPNTAIFDDERANIISIGLFLVLAGILSYRYKLGRNLFINGVDRFYAGLSSFGRIKNVVTPFEERTQQKVRKKFKSKK